MSYSEKLSAFALGLEREAIPETAFSWAKGLILDTIGVYFAGLSETTAGAVTKVVRSNGGEPEAAVWGQGYRVPVSQAVLAIAPVIHTLDYDDTHTESVNHLSACIVPTAIAEAERMDASGVDMLTAMVAAYEVGARLGLAAPHKFHARGFHGTSIVGTFTAATVLAHLRRLPVPLLSHAYGICGSMSSGLLQFIQEGSLVKRLHPGWAAHGGVLAAQFAEAGVTGPVEILEGNLGLYRSHLDEGAFDLSRILKGLGQTWEITRIAIKPYPCCHILHTFIDAALTLQRERPDLANQVSEIECRIDAKNLELLARPNALKQAPPDAYAAKFSLPYVVAAALVHGTFGPAQFAPDALRDPRVLALTRRVNSAVDPESDFPVHFPGYVSVVLETGERLNCREPYQLGAPERPVQQRDFEQKFRANVAHCNADWSEQVLETVMTLERQPVRHLVRLLASPCASGHQDP